MNLSATTIWLPVVLKPLDTMPMNAKTADISLSTIILVATDIAPLAKSSPEKSGFVKCSHFFLISLISILFLLYLIH